MSKSVERSGAKAGDAKEVAPGFVEGQYVVYPSHGLGKVVGVNEETVAGFALKMMDIEFVKERMRVRVPLAKIAEKGVRHLSDLATVERALKVLGDKPKVSKGLWSRKSADYEGRIAGGNLVVLAEVARDCFRSDVEEEASYSQRRIFETAIERMASEVALVQGRGEPEVRRFLEEVMTASPGRKAKAGKSAVAADDVGESEAA